MTDEQIEKASAAYVLERQLARRNAKKAEDATMSDFDKTRKFWTAYDMMQAYETGIRDSLSHQWISVDERLPPGTCLLMCINAREDKAYALCVYIRERFMIYDHTLSYKREFYPTHWMPIPQLNPEK